MNVRPPLSIVIPAYRSRYLARTLESLAAQTDRRFRVYVADDGSPEDLAAIVAPFATRLDLVYRRFPDNLGGTSLVRHWDRAIRLGDEPWVWLFSDDDLMAPECVAAVHARLERGPETAALLRFDVDLIDAAGATIRREAPFPAWLDAGGYVRRILEWSGELCMIQNIVFRRAVYEAAGGFADLPGGYCADVVTWPRFARAGGIRRLEAGRVCFRLHPDSLGSELGFHWARGGEAVRCYAAVIREFRAIAGPSVAADPAWRRAELEWFGHWFRFAEPLKPDVRAVVAREMSALWRNRPLAWRVAFWRNYGAVVARHYWLTAWLLRLRRSWRQGRLRPA
jgi:glycosyltransferase involved in cell wall biosynthesis